MKLSGRFTMKILLTIGFFWTVCFLLVRWQAANDRKKQEVRLPSADFGTLFFINVFIFVFSPYLAYLAYQEEKEHMLDFFRSRL